MITKLIAKQAAQKEAAVVDEGEAAGKRSMEKAEAAGRKEQKQREGVGRSSAKKEKGRGAGSGRSDMIYIVFFSLSRRLRRHSGSGGIFKVCGTTVRVCVCVPLCLCVG